MKKKLAVITCG